MADLECERALRFNATVVKLAAIAIMEDMVIVRETLRPATCDPDEILFPERHGRFGKCSGTGVHESLIAQV